MKHTDIANVISRACKFNREVNKLYHKQREIRQRLGQITIAANTVLTRWTYVFQCKLHRINVCSRQKAETVAFRCLGIVMCSRISIFPSWVFNTERTIQCKAHPPNPRTYHCSAVCCKGEEVPQSAPSPVNKATQGKKKKKNIGTI